MEPKESLETRRKMAEMHDSVLKRIDESYKNKQYVDVCWICYACFENRVNRVMAKICSGCLKESRTNNRPIGITTKLQCYARLIKNNYAPLCKEDINLINTVKGWCKERNDLIHSMVSLDLYAEADKKFENLAKRGMKLVEKMYVLGSDVRNYYYDAEEIPLFDVNIVNKCPLKSKCIKEEQ